MALTPLFFTACNEEDDENSVESTKPGTDIATLDGRVTTLQTAAEGNGINIILMGDGFTAADIMDGTYDEIMNKTMEALFCVHPMPALRKYFNVYSVQKVSTSSNMNGQTVFGTVTDGDMVSMTNSPLLDGANAKVQLYAKNVPGYTPGAENTFFAIVMNTELAGGITSHGGWNSYAFSYGTLYGTADGHKYRQMMTHELIGHGIAKLLDEYQPRSGGYTDDEVNAFAYGQSLGWYNNMSISSNIEDSPWADFAGDPRYADENIGMYLIDGTSLYKPCETSIMEYTDYPDMTFNAPSRRLIYNRIMELATGQTPEYEEFVAFDLANK